MFFHPVGVHVARNYQGLPRKRKVLITRSDIYKHQYHRIRFGHPCYGHVGYPVNAGIPVFRKERRSPDRGPGTGKESRAEVSRKRIKPGGKDTSMPPARIDGRDEGFLNQDEVGHARIRIVRDYIIGKPVAEHALSEIGSIGQRFRPSRMPLRSCRRSNRD